MHEFGLLNRLNGMDRLPYWKDSPCNNIVASEGSFFPPRKYNKNNTIYVYDKDLCRILPLVYVGPTSKSGKYNKDHFDLCPGSKITSLKIEVSTFKTQIFDFFLLMVMKTYKTFFRDQCGTMEAGRVCLRCFQRRESMFLSRC